MSRINRLVFVAHAATHQMAPSAERAEPLSNRLRNRAAPNVGGKRVVETAHRPSPGRLFLKTPAADGTVGA